ncbi:hypothetical protein ICNINCKA_00181 [Synechococcus sp. CBW1107]|nr:hypothetical protein ICNINCKA_00181 [Synechococcus sp. CBW1107]
MARADHHAGNVKEIALALTGAILWRKDDTDSIKVMERQGTTTNVLWVVIGGNRYAFSYNHTSGLIDMRQDSIQGPVLHTFSNSTPLSSLYSIFQAL